MSSLADACIQHGGKVLLSQAAMLSPLLEERQPSTRPMLILSLLLLVLPCLLKTDHLYKKRTLKVSSDLLVGLHRGFLDGI